MTWDCLYSEKAEIIETKYMDEFKVEHEVQLEVKGLTLICFDPPNAGDFSKGKKMTVCFILLSGAAIKGKIEKSIRLMEGFQERGWWGSNYEINGDLIAIQWNTFLREGKIHNNSEGTVDCGIFVNQITLPVDHQFKIGDYISAHGRLDVYDTNR